MMLQVLLLTTLVTASLCSRTLNPCQVKVARDCGVEFDASGDDWDRHRCCEIHKFTKCYIEALPHCDNTTEIVNEINEAVSTMSIRQCAVQCLLATQISFIEAHECKKFTNGKSLEYACGLSGVAIASIVLGVAVIFVIAVVVFMVRRRQE